MMLKVEDLNPLFKSQINISGGWSNSYNLNTNQSSGAAVGPPLDQRPATLTNFYKIAQLSRINYVFYQTYEPQPDISASSENQASSNSGTSTTTGTSTNTNGSTASPVKNAELIYVYEKIIKTKLEVEYNIKDIIFYIAKKEIFIFQVEAKNSNDEVGFNQLKDAIDNIINENKLLLRLLSANKFDSDTLSKPQYPTNGGNPAAQNRSLNIVYATFLKAVKRHVTLKLTKLHELPNSTIEILSFGNQLVIAEDSITSPASTSANTTNSLAVNSSTSVTSKKISSDKKKGDNFHNFYSILKINPSLGTNNQLMLNISVSQSFKFYKLSDLLQQNDFSFADRKDFVIYIAPTGVRCSCAIKNSMRDSITDEPPVNYERLLKLLSDHANINLSKDDYGNSQNHTAASESAQQLPSKKQFKRWMKLSPNLNHMNGMTPKISYFLETFTPNIKYIMWPLELCFVQLACDSELGASDNLNPSTATTSTSSGTHAAFVGTPTSALSNKGNLSNHPSPATAQPGTPVTTQPDFDVQIEDPLDLVEQFIDLNDKIETQKLEEIEKQKELQRAKEKQLLESQSNTAIATDMFPEDQTKMDLDGIQFDFDSNEFSTGMSVPTMNDWMKTMNDQEPQFIHPYSSNMHITDGDNNVIPNNIDDNKTNHNDANGNDVDAEEQNQSQDVNFNDENIDDLFDDTDEPKGATAAAEEDQKSDDWDELFGDMDEDVDNAEDDKENENENENGSKSPQYDGMKEDGENNGDQISVDQSNVSNSTDDANVKIEEHVESTDAAPANLVPPPSTALYEDPGAPSPIPFQIFASPSPESQPASATEDKFATPKDSKKSIFAPLNFNPLIEKDIDSKYSTGGKFFVKGELNSPVLPQHARLSQNESTSNTPSFLRTSDFTGIRSTFPNLGNVEDELDESSDESNAGDEAEEEDDDEEDDEIRRLGLDSINGEDNDDEDEDYEDEDDDEIGTYYDQNSAYEFNGYENNDGPFESINNENFTMDVIEDNPFIEKKKKADGLGIMNNGEPLSAASGTPTLVDSSGGSLLTPASASSNLPLVNQQLSSLLSTAASPTVANSPTTVQPNSNEIQNWLFWIIRGPQTCTFPSRFLKENPTISKDSLVEILPKLQDLILFSDFNSSNETEQDVILDDQRDDPKDLNINMRTMLNNVFPGLEKVKLYELLESTEPLKQVQPFQCLFETDQQQQEKIDTNDNANNNGALDYRMKYEGGYSIKNAFDDPSFATTSPLMNVSSVPDMNENAINHQDVRSFNGLKTSNESKVITNTSILNSISPDSLFRVPSTILNVKRLNQNMNVNETSLNFWNILNLQPVDGEKSFRVVLVAPKGFEFYLKKVGLFLNSLIDSYRSCKFGSIFKLEVTNEDLKNQGFKLNDGILEIDTNSCSNVSDYWDFVNSNLSSLAESVHKDYINKEAKSEIKSSDILPILLLFASPFGDLNSFISISAAVDQFTKRLTTFVTDQDSQDDKKKKRKSSMAKTQTASVPIVKTVPVKVFHKALSVDTIFSSKGNYSVYTSSKLTNICMNLYNLFPNDPTTISSDSDSLFLKNSQVAPFNNRSTFITISKDLPKRIYFMMTKQPIARNLTADELFFHLCYERSIDRQWCVASWTDQYGRCNFIKSWYIGENSPMCKSFEDVSNEIFDITLRCVGSHIGKVYILLTRLNNMIPDDELTEWKRLSMKHNRLTLIVLTVELESNTLILSDNEKEKENEDINQDVVYGSVNNRYTVGSATSMVTPFFNKVESPELNMNIASPSFGHDGTGAVNSMASPDTTTHNPNDSLLVDLNNDVYAVILQASHPLSNQAVRTSLRTGFLYSLNQKVFEVNLLSCHSGINSTELLKSILIQYKNLAQMSNVWGISSRHNTNDDAFDDSSKAPVNEEYNSIIPWHILVVRKTLDCLVHIRVQ